MPLIPPQPLPATGSDSEAEGMEGFARLEAEPEARRSRRGRFDQALPPEAAQLPTRGLRGRPELPSKILGDDRVPIGRPLRKEREDVPLRYHWDLISGFPVLGAVLRPVRSERAARGEIRAKTASCFLAENHVLCTNLTRLALRPVRLEVVLAGQCQVPGTEASTASR